MEATIASFSLLESGRSSALSSFARLSFMGGSLLGTVVDEVAVTPTIGLVLYGSRARGDHDHDSDVDLLAVTDGGTASKAVHDRVSICRYPLTEIVRRAGYGDLFVLHIVSEGRVIYQRSPVLEDMRNAFVYRPDYAREMALASDVGWFLVRHGDQLDPRRVNENMAWCTRTMLVARAASLRQPVFSAAGLAELAGCPEVVAVIKNKSSRSIDPGMVTRFREVLHRFGTTQPAPWRTLDEQRRAFEADRNAVGVNMVRTAMQCRWRAAMAADSEVALDVHA